MNELETLIMDLEYASYRYGRVIEVASGAKLGSEPWQEVKKLAREVGDVKKRALFLARNPEAMDSKEVSASDEPRTWFFGCPSCAIVFQASTTRDINEIAKDHGKGGTHQEGSRP